MNYPSTVDAYIVAEDEYKDYMENPEEFCKVEKESTQVFVTPTDKRVYWSHPNDVSNPKKWCKRYRDGMVKLTIPAVIVSEVDNENEEDFEEN